MSLFGRKEKQELEFLRSQMTPQQLEAADLAMKIKSAREELADITAKIAKESSALSKLKKQVIETDERVLLQSFGFYVPHYAYTTSDEYKEKLSSVRAQQKELVKSKCATTGRTDWEVNGSKSKGAKMVRDMQKLLLRAFNAECDDAIEHVRFNNIEACEKKILSSSDAISKLGEMLGVSIASPYISLKLDELHLMHEYQVKKQAEKEAAKELRQRQREEAKAAKELAEARKKLEKEQSHYQNALSRLNAQIAQASGDALVALDDKRAELETQLSTIEQELRDVDYRVANQRAGYVYIISNIGSFGEDVYKIGMTRRLEPMDRIDELGDASVPFNFDVHALIFTDDAPGLEASLHQAFADRKLNMINTRREFFHVTLDEIKEVVRQNYDKTVEFVDVPPAEQYRESLKMVIQCKPPEEIILYKE